MNNDYCSIFIHIAFLIDKGIKKKPKKLIKWFFRVDLQLKVSKMRLQFEGRHQRTVLSNLVNFLSQLSCVNRSVVMK